ncbi:hypothetical protein G6F65_014192 [Rhizopus arrhizus]|nr:hypothetical protein G6F65_014192 [Rhizopus arrhizus]
MHASPRPTRTDRFTPRWCCVHADVSAPASPRDEENDQNDDEHRSERCHQHISLAPAGLRFSWGIHGCTPVSADDPASVMDLNQCPRRGHVHATCTRWSVCRFQARSFGGTLEARPVGLQEPPDVSHPHCLRHLPRSRPGPGPRHARALGAGRTGRGLRRAAADLRRDEAARPPRKESIWADSDLAGRRTGPVRIRRHRPAPGRTVPGPVAARSGCAHARDHVDVRRAEHGGAADC